MNRIGTTASQLATRCLAISFLICVIAGTGCSGKSSPTAPQPTGPATLLVRSSPGAVPITIDGAPATAATPSSLSLAAGDHRVGLTYLGYRDTTISVSLAAEATETLTVALGPRPGTPRSFGAWQTNVGWPEELAAGPGGPVYVTATVANGTRVLTAFSLPGTPLFERSLGFNVPSGLAVAASGDVYLSLYVSGFGLVLERYSSAGVNLNTIYYTGTSSWPGLPRAAMGTDDTLMVLINAPQNAVVGVVFRYVNDQFVNLWRVGRTVSQLAVDRTARRCYFMDASDTVYVYSTGGQPLTKWKAGLFNSHPGELSVGADGSVYVADVSTVQRFSGDGVLLAAWGVGNIGSIWGMGVDGQGRVYLAANETKQVVRYVP